MLPERLQKFEELILKGRESLLRSVLKIDSEIHALVDEKPMEFNERAVEEAAIQTLAGLDYRRRKELSEIEQALARISIGTYGICVGCGNDISEDRLMALPYTKICKFCARKDSHPGLEA